MEIFHQIFLQSRSIFYPAFYNIALNSKQVVLGQTTSFQLYLKKHTCNSQSLELEELIFQQEFGCLKLPKRFLHFYQTRCKLQISLSLVVETGLFHWHFFAIM